MTVLPFYSESLENFSLKEEGLKLEPKVRSWLKTRLDSLSNKIPSTAKLYLRFQWSDSDETTLSADLEIRGPNCSLKSIVIGTNPKFMFQLLEKDLKQQLREWKQQRFLQENSLLVLS